VPSPRRARTRSTRPSARIERLRHTAPVKFAENWAIWRRLATLSDMTALIHTLFPPDTAPARIKGEVRFVTAQERSHSHGSLGLLLTVCVPPLPWPDGAGIGQVRRGRLRDAIESAIESALELNDAPPAGVGDLTDLDQSLSDHLYRARSVGAGGLVLYLPDLTSAPMARLHGSSIWSSGGRKKRTLLRPSRAPHASRSERTTASKRPRGPRSALRPRATWSSRG